MLSFAEKLFRIVARHSVRSVYVDTKSWALQFAFYDDPFYNGRYNVAQDLRR